MFIAIGEPLMAIESFRGSRRTAGPDTTKEPRVHTVLALVRGVGEISDSFFVVAVPLRVELENGCASIKVMCAPSLLEPCVFGVFRPVLLLPNGIQDRLTPDQLEAILLHELSHIRRHDNLTAAIHMAVETLFWFYPILSWIGNRLMDERERACDEEVLRAIGKPELYAQGILNVCRFCLESSPVCAAGITGFSLKKRIEGVMTNPIAQKLGLGRKALIITAATVALSAPLLVGLLNAPFTQAQSQSLSRPSFEVASVKDFKEPDTQGPRHFKASYGPQGINFATSLPFMIAEAYDVPPGHLVLPSSLSREALLGAFGDGYEIIASAGRPVPKDQLRLMMQSLLADRFRLTVHRESRPGQVYRLAVAKDGPGLEESKAGGDLVLAADIDKFVFRNAEINRLCGYLSSRLDRMVIDATGLKGIYNFVVKMPEDANEQPVAKDAAGIDKPSAAMYAVVMKQLGLRLIADKALVEYLVIDHVERPTRN